MDIIKIRTSYQEPYPLQVQGESHYKENIEDVTGYLGEDEGVNCDDLIARLILDDDNPFDPGNAVRVEIDNKIVGHLSKQDSKKYRARLATLGFSNAIGECYASVKGGFIKRSTGEQADFGVRLDISLNDFQLA